MRGSNTALGDGLRNQEEVKAVRILMVLDELGVNDTTWLWVTGPAIRALDEHPLVDPLVDDDKSDWWNATDLVVVGLQGLLEL